MCGSLLREDIVLEANNSVAFSILADETTDISGIEQMSLGVRYVKEQNGKMMVTENSWDIFQLSIEQLKAPSLQIH